MRKATVFWRNPRQFLHSIFFATVAGVDQDNLRDVKDS
jgi:hypothetical protein